MGGALAFDAAWLFAAFLVLLVLAAAVIAVRRYLLERGGGTVECGLRKAGGPWRLGVASYRLDELCWFGVFGVSMRPEETFPRRDLNVLSRRLPTDAETAILGPGMIVLECALGDSGPFGQGGAPGRSGTVELALPESALTGLLAWLEAAPPGSHLGVALLTTIPACQAAACRAAACRVSRVSRARRLAATARRRAPSWPAGPG